jgi:membrane-bound lytic murein transglycosylase A
MLEKKKKLLLHYMVLLLLLFLFTGCALFVKPRAIPPLERLSKRQINLYNWEDDLNYEGLQQAVERSITYYKRLPQTHVFHYNEIVYSPGEMIASLNLFLDIMKSFKGEERLKQLREKFLFFESKNSAGEAFFTGYYEPLLEGSPVPIEGFTEPVYETPDDLIEVDLGQFSEKCEKEKIVGRLEGKRLVPYDSREEIVYNNSLKDRAKPIAYVNEIELFFLQIQGSGVIKFPDGTLKRVNYAQKNGHPYRSIGEILKDKIPPEEMSMQAIKSYLYNHPDEVREILSYNQSYVFFREVTEGPLGDIEVPLTPGRSVAMDKRVIPRGGLAFIETKIPVFKNGRISSLKPIKRFVLVQDTGGVIRGHGRVDIFLGNGEEAGMIAGHLQQTGRVFLIVARKEYLQ